MACLNACCPPHNFVATADPTGSDCEDSVVPGYESSGGYCPGSKWYNTVDDSWWIGVNDMACNTAQWKRITPVLEPLAHVRRQLGTWQVIPTGVATKLDFVTAQWDANTDWDVANQRFVAPRDGYYDVKVFTRPATPSGLSTTGWELGNSFYVTGLINGVLTANSGIGGIYTFQHDTGSSQVFERIQLVSASTVYMSAGDLFTVNMNHDATGSQGFHPTNTQLIIDEVLTNGLF